MSMLANFRVPFRRIVFALLLLCAATLTAHAQAGPIPILDPSQIGPRLPDRSNAADTQEITQSNRQQRLLNTARHKAIVSDADKLLALARQLNARVNADGSALTSTERMRIAGEIEKLAHNVKERMSYTMAGDPDPNNPFHGWPQ